MDRTTAAIAAALVAIGAASAGIYSLSGEPSTMPADAGEAGPDCIRLERRDTGEAGCLASTADGAALLAAARSLTTDPQRIVVFPAEACASGFGIEAFGASGYASDCLAPAEAAP